MLKLIFAFLAGLYAGALIVKPAKSETISANPALACDTFDAIKDVMGTHVADGQQAGAARFRFYHQMKNETGEGVCMIGPIREITVLRKVATVEHVVFGNKAYIATILEATYGTRIFYISVLTKLPGSDA